MTLPWYDSYKMECWGAQGGGVSYVEAVHNAVTNTLIGGYGAYTEGIISMSAGKTLYVYVGGNSVTGSTFTNAIDQPSGYSFNGGVYTTNGYGTKCAGGATDIRTVKGTSSRTISKSYPDYGSTVTHTLPTWADLTSLKSRIIVAAGGGSAGDRGNGCGGGDGAPAGGLSGYDSQLHYGTLKPENVNHYNGGGYGHGATQTAPGTQTAFNTDPKGALDPRDQTYGNGAFGRGGYGQDGQGGGGWYGGGASWHRSGASGSSYISGHTGCKAIKQSASVDTGGSSLHETSSVAVIGGVSYQFTSTVMIDGFGRKWTSTTQPTDSNREQMPKPSSGYYDLGKGHTGTGYAKITSQ